MGEAEVEYAEAVAHHPKSPESWVAYADWFMRRSRPARAEAILRKGLSISPAQPHYIQHWKAEAQGYAPLARKAYNTAHELAPEQPKFLNPLARLEFLAGSHGRAIKLWEAPTQAAVLIMNRCVICRRHTKRWASTQKLPARLKRSWPVNQEKRIFGAPSPTYMSTGQVCRRD